MNHDRRVLVEALQRQCRETSRRMGAFAMTFDGEVVHDGPRDRVVEACLGRSRGEDRLWFQRTRHPYDGTDNRCDRRVVGGPGRPLTDNMDDPLVKVLERVVLVSDRDRTIAATGADPFVGPPAWSFRIHRVFAGLLRHFGHDPRLLARPGLIDEYGIRAEIVAGAAPKDSTIDLRMDRIHSVRTYFNRIVAQEGGGSRRVPEITFSQVPHGAIVTVHGLHLEGARMQALRRKKLDDVGIHPAIVGTGLRILNIHDTTQGLHLRIDEVNEPVEKAPQGVVPTWLGRCEI